MCKKSFWVKSLWVKSMCKKGFWVKSLWVKSMWGKSQWVKNHWGKIGVDGMLAFVPPFSGFCLATSSNQLRPAPLLEPPDMGGGNKHVSSSVSASVLAFTVSPVPS